MCSQSVILWYKSSEFIKWYCFDLPLTPSHQWAQQGSQGSCWPSWLHSPAGAAHQGVTRCGRQLLLPPNQCVSPVPQPAFHLSFVPAPKDFCSQEPCTPQLSCAFFAHMLELHHVRPGVTASPALVSFILEVIGKCILLHCDNCLLSKLSKFLGFNATTFLL